VELVESIWTNPPLELAAPVWAVRADMGTLAVATPGRLGNRRGLGTTLWSDQRPKTADAMHLHRLPARAANCRESATG
jgi:hypothetical protein